MKLFGFACIQCRLGFFLNRFKFPHHGSVLVLPHGLSHFCCYMYSLVSLLLFSLHIRSMWETICDAQAGFWLNSKFLSKFSRKPLSGISDQKAPLPPILENFRFEMTKVYSGIPPSHFRKLQIWDDQSLLWNTPHFGKLQIWDDQSLLRKTPLFRKTSDLRWPKFTPEYPPPPFRKTSDLRWPKFTSEYFPLPISENFRFEMTKVYSRIPPPPFLKMREIVCGD